MDIKVNIAFDIYSIVPMRMWYASFDGGSPLGVSSPKRVLSVLLGSFDLSVSTPFMTSEVVSEVSLSRQSGRYFLESLDPLAIKGRSYRRLHARYLDSTEFGELPLHR